MTCVGFDRPERARIGRVLTMVAHQEELAGRDDPAVLVARHGRRLGGFVGLRVDVGLAELGAVDEHAAVADLDRVAAETDDALDERRVVLLDPKSAGGLNTTISPRLYVSKRGVSLSTRTYWSGSSVCSIDCCWTLYGWAMNVWMTRKMISVRTSVSTISKRHPSMGRRVTRRGSIGAGLRARRWPRRGCISRRRGRV